RLVLRLRQFLFDLDRKKRLNAKGAKGTRRRSDPIAIFAKHRVLCVKVRLWWVSRCSTHPPELLRNGTASAVKIASWNVNSVKVRMPHLLDFLKSAQPDVLCLQEIKCLADDFPRLEVQALGYRVECIGQRAYNGVALISKEPPRDLICGLPGFDDEQARYIEASFSGATGEHVRVGSLYLPNGNPIGTDKFTYKLAWMEGLHDH